MRVHLRRYHSTAISASARIHRSRVRESALHLAKYDVSHCTPRRFKVNSCRFSTKNLGDRLRRLHCTNKKAAEADRYAISRTADQLKRPHAKSDAFTGNISRSHQAPISASPFRNRAAAEYPKCNNQAGLTEIGISKVQQPSQADRNRNIQSATTKPGCSKSEYPKCNNQARLTEIGISKVQQPSQAARNRNIQSATTKPGCSKSEYPKCNNQANCRR
jgi:hypothetical protein